MDLHFAHEAAEEIREALFHYRGGGADLLDRFERALTVALEEIRSHPARYPRHEHASEGSNVRIFLLHRFPYSIVYEPLEEDIFVLALAHFRRRPGYWRGRKGDEPPA